MASEDMRLSLDFVSHKKTKQLIRLVGYEGFYWLLKLFSIAGRLYPNGILQNCSEVDVEDIIEWNGEPGAFVHAAVDVGFLDVIDQGFKIHDWEVHQPWLKGAKDRSEQARKAVQTRWDKEKNLKSDTHDTDSIQTEYEQNTSSNTNSNTDRNTPSPSPIPKTKKDNPLLSKESCPPQKESAASGMRRAPLKFTKPTVSQVQEYCTKRRNTVNPQQFIDHYESKGWLIGKAPMKDWQAAVRTWEHNGIQNSKQPSIVERQSNSRFDEDDFDPLAPVKRTEADYAGYDENPFETRRNA